jgi:hypothetical protein
MLGELQGYEKEQESGRESGSNGNSLIFVPK